MTKRRRRRLLILFTAVAVVAVVLVIGRWWVIDFATRQVDARLEALNGGPVTVAHYSFDIALSGLQIELRDVRFRQRVSTRPAWLTVESAAFPLTTADLFAGRIDPHRIDMDGLQVQIDLDRDGKLVTQLPAASGGLRLPVDQLAVHSARFELHQEGRDTLVADRVALRVDQPGESLDVTGTIGALLGGSWSLDLKLDGTTLGTSVRLVSAEVAIDSAGLGRLPLAPAALRKTIRVGGVSAVAVEIERPAARRPKYRVALTPKALTIEWPQIDLTLRDVTGSLVVDDGRVSLAGLRASLAGARAELSGQIDLQSAVANGQLEATIEGLSLASLPPRWTVPQGIAGTLSSKFDLSWEGAGEGVRVRGGGQGRLDDARLAGLDFRPIQVQWQLEDPPPAAKQPLSATDSATLALDVATEGVGLTSLLDRLQIDPRSLAIDARALISAAGQLRIPLATADDLQSYRGAVQLGLVQAADSRQRVRSAAAEVTFEADSTITTRLDLALAGAGHVHAEATAESAAAGEARGQIVCDQIPLAVARRWLGVSNETVRGTWSARGDWSVPLSQWRDVVAWRGKGQLEVAQAEVRGESIGNIAVRVAVDKGRLSATQAQAVWQGMPIEAQGTVELQPPYRFGGQLGPIDVQLRQIIAVAQPGWSGHLAGATTVRGQFSGTLAPNSWTASGQGDVVGLAITGLPVAGPKFRWSVDADHWSLSDVRAGVADGTVELSVTLPRHTPTGGRVEGRFDRVLAGQLADGLEALPVTMAGPISGRFLISDLRGPALAGEVDFRAGSAVIRDVAVQQINGRVAYRQGEAQVELHGKALDGDVLLKGTVTQRPVIGAESSTSTSPQRRIATLHSATSLQLVSVAPQAEPPPASSSVLSAPRPLNLSDTLRFDGELQLRGGRLQRLRDLVGPQTWLRRLAGDVDIELDVHLDGAKPSAAATGRIEFRDIRWDGTELLRLVTGRVELAEGQVRVSDVSARGVDGRVSAELVLGSSAGNEGTFSVHLDRVRVERLLAPWPKLARQVQGVYDLRVEGKLGRRWRGRGQLQMRSGQIGGVPVRGSRVPLRWDFEPARGSGRVIVRGGVVQLHRGHVRFETQVELGHHLNVDATARVQAVDVRDLTGGLPEIQERVTGRLDGQITLAGRNVRSLDDLTGTFKASLGQSHVLSLPVFDQLVDALIVGQILSPGFETSSVEGRFARGMVSIRRMTLVGSGLQLLIEGNVTTSGRLDLDVTADTGQLSAPLVACRVLVNPSGFLRRRLIFLHVGGTVRTPIVQLRPMRQIDQEIQIFFLL